MSEKRTIDSVEDDPTLSLQDIINEDRELETMANAVLSGSNDQSCTYADGYISRQALYACSTCKTNGEAGICLACSLECHDGHELYELYTKRNFRCDCGNSKFPELKCSLTENKLLLNENNVYNHNFNGSYCTCKRPYPDPEDDVDDEMIQCVVCEDWFHFRHLLGNSPENGYSEVICHICMSGKAKLLWYYFWDLTNTDNLVDVCSTDDTVPRPSTTPSVEALRKDTTEVTKNERCENEEIHLNHQSISSSSAENSVDSGTTVKHECLTNLMKTYEPRLFPDSAAFWPEHWREHLCPCSNCKAKLIGLDFLYSAGDTVAEYEKLGAHKYHESSEVSGMRALSGMNRVQQVEVIHGYNDMKDKLSEFLKTFAEQGKIVTEQDIRNFFQRMTEAKRPRIDVSHSCK